MIPKTINTRQMHEINRSAVLEYFRLNSPSTLTDVASASDLSMNSVMKISNELIQENWLIEYEQGNKGKDPKLSLLSYNDNACLVIGIDLGGTKLYGALSNLGGEIVNEINVKHHDTTGEETFEIVVGMIRKLLDSAPATIPVRGVAVGAPGITQTPEGIVEWAPGLNWQSFPLQQRLMDRFQLPMFVENDVNLAVLGEHRFGSSRDVQNMMLITIGTGVGAGLIIDGVLYRGYSNSAGEIGYILPDVKSLKNTYDDFGALEGIISGSGIAERAAGIKQDHRSPTTKEVFHAAQNGESWAERILQETLDYMALGIANINTILDLELIVMGGGVAQQSDILIDGIFQRIEGVIPRIPRIEASSLGTRATVMGAIVLVMQNTDNYYVVRKQS